MSIDVELREFYRRCGFGDTPGERVPRTVKVYTGCMLVPLPNIETRRRFLRSRNLYSRRARHDVDNSRWDGVETLRRDIRSRQTGEAHGSLLSSARRSIHAHGCSVY